MVSIAQIKYWTKTIWTVRIYLPLKVIICNIWRLVLKLKIGTSSRSKWRNTVHWFAHNSLLSYIYYTFHPPLPRTGPTNRETATLHQIAIKNAPQTCPPTNVMEVSILWSFLLPQNTPFLHIDTT